MQTYVKTKRSLNHPAPGGAVHNLAGLEHVRSGDNCVAWYLPPALGDIGFRVWPKFQPLFTYKIMDAGSISVCITSVRAYSNKMWHEWPRLAELGANGKGDGAFKERQSFPSQLPSLLLQECSKLLRSSLCVSLFQSQPIYPPTCFIG